MLVGSSQSVVLKKYESKQRIQEIVTGWSVLVGGYRWTRMTKEGKETSTNEAK